MGMAINQYVYKFGIAVLATPLVYAGHYLIDWYLGDETARRMIAAHTQDAMPSAPPIA